MSAKRKRIAACAVGGMCLFLLLAGALMIPETNRAGVQTVKLSHEPGFYDEPFDLELSFDGGNIYYTLDSTDPDENDTLYEGPIRIEDASTNPNVYANITDVSLEFSPDILKHSKQKPRFGYQTPTVNLDKATVVRAVGIDASGNRSDVVNAAYFVGFSEKTGYDRMGIIAITTDPANLFDFERGIYVTGKTFADKLTDGYYKVTGTLFEGWPANYNRRGIQWEREANVRCYSPDRTVLFSGNCGIRIQGGVSRGMLPKSLNIFARKQYGDSVIQAKPLFGVDWQLGSMNLTSGSESYRARIHDCLVNTMIDNLNIDTRIYKPYELFLDGEYWGVYWLTPRYEKEYFQSKYGVEGDDVIFIKDGKVEIGEESDAKYYTSMMSFICKNDMRDPELYAQACEMIDISSCIDYYAAEIYVRNWDWPQKNKGLWRTRKSNGGVYADGRWRWVLYDVNVAMSSKNAEDEYIPKVKKGDKLFRSLMRNKSFSRAFYTKLADLAEEQFNPDRVETWIRDYEAWMLDAMENEYERFYGGSLTGETFIATCERIAGFYRNRSAFMLASYGNTRERAAE